MRLEASSGILRSSKIVAKRPSDRHKNLGLLWLGVLIEHSNPLKQIRHQVGGAYRPKSLWFTWSLNTLAETTMIGERGLSRSKRLFSEFINFHPAIPYGFYSSLLLIQPFLPFIRERSLTYRSLDRWAGHLISILVHTSFHFICGEPQFFLIWSSLQIWIWTYLLIWQRWALKSVWRKCRNFRKSQS